MERYNYLLDLLVSSGHPVLLAGAPGVGKTSLIQQLVLPKHTSSTVVMSHGMTAARLQTSIIGHIHEIQSRAMGVMPGPGAGGAGSQAKQSHLFFIDDLSMAPTVGGWFTATLLMSTPIFVEAWVLGNDCFALLCLKYCCVLNRNAELNTGQLLKELMPFLKTKQNV